MSYVQSNMIEQTQVAVDSLDVVMGVVGGLAAVIWSILHFLFDDYQLFKLQNSIISQIYPTMPSAKEKTYESEDSAYHGLI